MYVEALSSLCFRNTTRTSSHPRLDFKRRLKINRRNFTFDVIAIRKDLSEDLSAVIKDIPLPCNLQIAFVNIQYFERAFDELLSNHRRIPITCRRNVMGQTWPNNIRDWVIAEKDYCEQRFFFLHRMRKAAFLFPFHYDMNIQGKRERSKRAI